MKNRKFREIAESDVGRYQFTAFGHSWMSADFMGAITKADVGRRVYFDQGEISVESSAQFKARVGSVPVATECAAGAMTVRGRAALRAFVRATEALLLGFSAEEVGLIADHVGKYGTDGGEGGGDSALVDAVVLSCLRVIVDNHGRRR